MFKVMNFFMKKGLKKTCMQDNLFSGSFYFLLMLVYLLNNVVACFVVSIYSEFVMWLEAVMLSMAANNWTLLVSHTVDNMQFVYYQY